MVSKGYFETLRIALLDGRDFMDQDVAGAPNVAVVDEAFARRFWPGVRPIGRRFRMAAGIAASDVFTVIGVVRSTKSVSLGEATAPALYLHYEQRPIASLFMGVVARTRGTPGEMVPLLRREIHTLNPAVEPLSVESMEEYIRPAFAQLRIAATLVGALSLAALCLASLGLYGVMAYLVMRRTHEIGVRVALGARPGHVFRLVFGQTAKLVALGEALGLAAAFVAARFLASVLYGVDPGDPAPFLGVPLIFGCVASLACYVPIRRALRVEPTIALRSE